MKRLPSPSNLTKSHAQKLCVSFFGSENSGSTFFNYTTGKIESQMKPLEKSIGFESYLDVKRVVQSNAF